MSDLSETEALALDFVLEVGSMLCSLSAGLVAAASAGDVASTEAALWQIRRALIEAARTWREAVPALNEERAE